MMQASDAQIGDGLDRLDVRGRDRLTRDARRGAAAAALDAALLAAPAIPIASLMWRFVGTVDPLAVVTLALGVPVMVFAVRYAMARRGGDTPARDRALALLDRDLALKDRLTGSDQFLRDPGRGGFERAALAEAASWIERAQSMALAPHGRDMTTVVRRRWPFPLAAVSILALALALPHGAVGAASGGRDVRADAPAFAAASTDIARLTDRRVAAGTADATRAGATGASAEASPAAASPGVVSRATAALGVAMRSAIAAMTGGNSAARSDTAGTSSEDRSKAGAGSPRGGDGQGASTDAAQAGSPSVPSTARPTDAQGDRRPAAGSDRTTAVAAAQSGQASAAQQGAPSQRSGPPKSPGSNPGQPPQSRDGKQDETGEQSGANPGQSSGNGRSGKRSGDDEGVKKGRGFAGMLLAKPIRDQIGGMTNRGAISVVTGPAAPQPFPSDRVAAQARGSNGGDAGRVPHRGAGAYETRLVRDYFGARENR